MPHYDFTCDSCGHNEPDYWMSMKDYRRIDCPACGAKMRQIFHPPMIGGDLPTIGCWNGYYDPTLGANITSRSQRENLMKQKGLVDFHMDSEEQAVFEEAKYINKHAGKGEARGVVNELAGEVEKKRADRALDKVIDPVIDKAFAQSGA